MWRIENPELRSAKLDFTSSDQGWRDVTQLFAGEVRLINAVELVDWDTEDMQVLVVETSEFIDWKALVVDGDDYRLVVDSRFVIVICARAAADS